MVVLWIHWWSPEQQPLQPRMLGSLSRLRLPRLHRLRVLLLPPLWYYLERLEKLDRFGYLGQTRSARVSRMRAAINVDERLE